MIFRPVPEKFVTEQKARKTQIEDSAKHLNIDRHEHSAKLYNLKT